MVKGGVAFLAFAGPALAGVIARGGEPGGEPQVGTIVGTNYPGKRSARLSYCL
ncbi:hypothetical protein M747DRAFT_346030 [Aspergillus niger ATCC 13496]|uniref:Uncharacterized protein n=1 Tax=Aspergillus niger ATCC 13496 TaxID=1353008 RepID=A0A370BJ18_ASPNG|nr:hypothetical protein M747DRAFT_346030 [Aspergillus niger ATCC 13496]